MEQTESENMLSYTTSQGEIYYAGERLTSLDERFVSYRVSNRKHLALYLFAGGVCETAVFDRIFYMLQFACPAYVKKYIAWPREFVYLGGSIVGFTIEYLEEAVSIDKFFSQNVSISYNQKLQIAKNLCIAFQCLQNLDIVCGITHAFRFVVEPTTLRVLICDPLFLIFPRDSIGFGDANCPIAVTPLGSLPDPILNQFLLGNKEKIELNTATDNYGLLVILFSLLYQGVHPMSYLKAGKEVGKDWVEDVYDRNNHWKWHLNQRPRYSFLKGDNPKSAFLRLTRFKRSNTGSLFVKTLNHNSALSYLYPSPHQWIHVITKDQHGIIGTFSFWADKFRRNNRALTKSSKTKANTDILQLVNFDTVDTHLLSLRRTYWKITLLAAIMCGAFVPFVDSQQFPNYLDVSAIMVVSSDHQVMTHMLWCILPTLLCVIVCNALFLRRITFKGIEKRAYLISLILAFVVSFACSYLFGLYVAVI